MSVNCFHSSATSVLFNGPGEDDCAMSVSRVFSEMLQFHPLNESFRPVLLQEYMTAYRVHLHVCGISMRPSHIFVREPHKPHAYTSKQCPAQI